MWTLTMQISPQRAAAGMGALVVVLLGAGTAAATKVEPSPGAPGPSLRAAAPVASAQEESIPAPETPIGLLPGPAARPPPPVEAAAPSTTSGPPPTTASSTTITRPPPAPPPRPATPPASPAEPTSSYVTMWSNLAPDWAEAGTTMMVNGGGCLGRAAAVSIVTRDPQGTPLGRYSGSPRGDGTWSVPITWDVHLTTGRYKVEAECVRGTDRFAYQLHTFCLNTASRPEDRPPTGPNIPSTG